MLEFVLSCTEVVTFFHNHHVLKAKLKFALESAKLKALVTMVLTQWGIIQGLLQSLLDADNVLNSIASEQDFLNLGQPSRRRRDKRSMIF